MSYKICKWQQVSICSARMHTRVITQPAMMQASEAFYGSLPGGKGLFWAMFVVATAAAIVASQALISATFAIVSQVNL